MVMSSRLPTGVGTKYNVPITLAKLYIFIEMHDSECIIFYETSLIPVYMAVWGLDYMVLICIFAAKL